MHQNKPLLLDTSAGENLACGACPKKIRVRWIEKNLSISFPDCSNWFCWSGDGLHRIAKYLLRSSWDWQMDVFKVTKFLEPLRLVMCQLWRNPKTCPCWWKKMSCPVPLKFHFFIFFPKHYQALKSPIVCIYSVYIIYPLIFVDILHDLIFFVVHAQAFFLLLEIRTGLLWARKGNLFPQIHYMI
jgi:hypothetical protein